MVDREFVLPWIQSDLGDEDIKKALAYAQDIIESIKIKMTL